MKHAKGHAHASRSKQYAMHPAKQAMSIYKSQLVFKVLCAGMMCIMYTDHLDVQLAVHSVWHAAKALDAAHTG